MRASELLGADVTDAAGRRIGKVRDIRLASDDPTDSRPGRRIAVTSLVVGKTTWPHRWGLADGRTRGPALLRLAAARAARGWVVVPIEHIAACAPGVVTLSVDGEQLPRGSDQ